MLSFLGVALLSTAGWLLSLTYPRSAARRHLVLCATLAACLLLPAVLSLRAATAWTLLAIPGSLGAERPTDGPVPMDEGSREQADLPPLRNDDETAASSVAAGATSSSGLGTGNEERSSASSLAELIDAGPTNDSASPPGRLENLPHTPAAHESGSPNWRTALYRWVPTAYTVVAGLLLLRIVAGLIAVLRSKRCAAIVDVFAGDIPVLEADVAVPLAIGFGRAAIVLPRGFRESIEPAELRDVLTHEAEHLQRGDHWVMLLQGLLAAAWWPVVTVHLLNRALSRAREELCDNAVLAGRDPASYGQTLLTVAERMPGGPAFAARLAPSVVARGELERRVAGILDDRRDRRMQVGRCARWTAALGLLTVGSLAITTRVVAVAGEPQQKQSRPSATDDTTPKQPTPAQPAAIRWTGVPTVDRENPTLHRGVVLGPDGKPLAGASVHAASTIELLERAAADKVDPKSLGPVRAVTDAEGQFQFDAPDLTWVTPAGVRKRWEALLVATKEGIVPGWLRTYGEDRGFRSHEHPHPNTDVAIRTRPAAALAGRLLLKGGEPLVGARVRLTGLMAPMEYDLARHIPRQEEKPLGLFSGVDYAEALYRPWVLPGLITETATDKEGRFELAGLPEGFIAQLEFTHPQAVTTSPRVAIRRIESVYRKPMELFENQGQPELTLYGSGFTAELEKGTVLRGEVVSSEWGSTKKGAGGVTVALAKHNALEGMSGQRFTTDADGRFEVTGLPSRPEGYELAFVGSFAAPWRPHRQKIVSGQEARVALTPAIPYRLTLTDQQGNAVDRKVYSIELQQIPVHHDMDERFNTAELIAPGAYRGLVPAGPAAVLIERRKSDRPVSVNPKAFFAPGRTDWTLEEQRYVYGDAWRIAGVGGPQTGYGTRLYDQLELAAAVLTNARAENGVLELTAVIHSDPPVEFTLVDEAGQPVEKARVVRQLTRYDAEGLPAAFSVQGLHPERAEFMMFRQEARGLIATLKATWSGEPVRVILRPAATLRGRFVKKSGELDFDFGARIMSAAVMPDTYVAGRMYNITDKPGERNGEFQLVVPPGVELRGDFVRKNPDWRTRPTVGTAFGPLTPKPGEVIELGDVRVP